MADEKLEYLERICVAAERIASVLDPPHRQERRPAILSTAIYSQEERDRETLRQSLDKKAAQSKRRAAAPPQR